MTSRLCCVVGCTNHGYVIKKWNSEECRTHNVKHEDCVCDPPFLLYPFPTERNNAEARRRWAKIINRKDKKTSRNWQPTPYSRVCSYHFADGQPTSKNPDPTLHLGYEATYNTSACRTRRREATSITSACGTLRRRSIGTQSMGPSLKSSKLDISDQPPFQQFPNSPQLDVTDQTTTEQIPIHFDKSLLAEEIPISLPEQITAIPSDDHNYTLPTKFPDYSDSSAALKKDLVTHFPGSTPTEECHDPYPAGLYDKPFKPRKRPLNRSRITPGIPHKLPKLPYAVMKPLDIGREVEVADCCGKTKIKTRIDNEEYLRKHPEVVILLPRFLRELLLQRPNNVREFAAAYFTSPELPSSLKLELLHMDTKP